MKKYSGWGESLLMISAVLALVGLVVAAVLGWIFNIATIWAYDGGLSFKIVLRCIGVVVPPLGAVLGYV